MLKNIRKMFIALLAVNLSSMAIIQGQESTIEIDPFKEIPERTETNEPPIDTTPEDPQPTESEPTTQAPTNTTTTTQWVPPTEPYYTTTYGIPEPEPEERQEITTVEQVTEETTVEDLGYGSLNEANLNGLLAYSLNSQEFALAWEDYTFIVNNYKLRDVLMPVEAGTTLQEIQETFQGNGTFQEGKNAFGQKVFVAEYDQELVRAIEDQVEILESSAAEGQETDQATLAKIVLTFDDQDYLIGSGLFQGEEDLLELEGVHPAMLAGLADSPVEALHHTNLGVIGIYQVMADGSIFSSLIVESEEENQQELVIVNSYNVFSHESIQNPDGEFLDYPGLNQSKLYVFLESQFEAIELAEKEAQEETNLEETNGAETSGESTTIEDTTSETTGTEETADQETTSAESTETSEIAESNQESTQAQEAGTFLEEYGPEDEVIEDKLVDFDQIQRGYNTLKSRVINGELNQTREDVVRAIGPTSLEAVNEIGPVLKYYSVEDERVGILQVQYNQETNELVSMRYEVRTPRLEEDFPINLDELINIASQNINSESLISELGEPVVIEHHFDGGETVRYLWTSLTDPEMRNIELIRNSADNSYELFYYDQYQEESQENN